MAEIAEMEAKEDAEELSMLRATRSSIAAFHLLLRKLNEDLGIMASNYRALTSANEEWRKITATMAPSAEGDPPTVEQQRFLREKLNELFRVHRESTVSVQALVSELESARPGFVPQHQLAAVLDNLSAAKIVTMAGNTILRK
eukprot:m.420291 g.420291  ORF g.420291 m.420291 type:complete len:143 (+) comp32400_c0_seq1:221-649(+)